MYDFSGGMPSFGTPGMSSVDLTTLQALLPTLVTTAKQTITQTQTPPKTPLDDHRQYLKELPMEVREGIENNPEYRQIKAGMMEDLLVWIIGGTALGTEYVSGPGERYVEALTKKAKELEPTVKTAKDQEVTELKQQVNVLIQALQESKEEQAKSQNKLDLLYQKLGEDPKVVITKEKTTNGS